MLRVISCNNQGKRLQQPEQKNLYPNDNGKLILAYLILYPKCQIKLVRPVIKFTLKLDNNFCSILAEYLSDEIDLI